MILNLANSFGNGEIHIDASRIVAAWEKNESYVICFDSAISKGKEATLCVDRESYERVVGYLDSAPLEATIESIMFDEADNVKSLSELNAKLREAQSLRDFVEIFGIDLYSGDNWTWRDVAGLMADYLDACDVVGVVE